MNQILSFQSSINGRKILLRKVRYLAIFLILLALVFIFEGSWNLCKNLNKKVNIQKPTVTGHINMGRTDFKVVSDIGVRKIIYSWTNGEDTVIEKDGELQTTFEVENRIGVNELNIKIIDSDGNTIIYDGIKIVYDAEEDDDGMGSEEDDILNMTEEEWEIAIANDTTEPEVSLSSEKGKVVITAVDKLMMSHVIYSWNDGEETRITGLSSDERSIIAKVDALKGDNKIKVKAYDKAGNVKEIEKDVHGTDGPQISVKKDNGKLLINIKDEYEITKIEYNFNNEKKTIENVNGKTYELELDLIEGDNFIIIDAYEGTVKSQYKGKTTN